MINLIKEDAQELKFLFSKFSYFTEKELCLCFSNQRTSKFDELTSKEAQKVLNFLREHETKRNLTWLILLYAFELDIIDSLAYAYQPSALVVITDFLKNYGVVDKALNELELDEYERVLNHLRLLFKLENTSIGDKTQRQISNGIKNKTVFMKPITPAQLKCLNTLVSKQGISKDDKEAIVSGFSNGRATSSKDLFFKEAIEMIKHLKASDPTERMRRKIFALAYEAGIIYDDEPGDKQINPAKINLFLKERGTVKKELNKMTSAELVKVVSQFQQIVKHSKETNANKAANKAAQSLLEELNITVTKTRQKTT